MHRTIVLWLAFGWAGLLLLPWYGVPGGFWDFGWLSGSYPTGEAAAPGILHAVSHGRPWLLLIAAAMAAPLLALSRRRSDPAFSAILIAAGAFGLGWFVLQGFAIGLGGWRSGALEAVFGPVAAQPGLGAGAALTGAALLFFLTTGLAARGAVNGDGFIVGAIGAVIALVGAFILFPVIQILLTAFQDRTGDFAPGSFLQAFSSARIWGLACLTEGRSCGVAWNSLLLAVATGVSTTVLGLAFALIATRTGFPAKRLLRALTILPIITPPFVIGLAIILLFGRSGAVTTFLNDLLGIPRSRWIYGFPGVWFAQTLAFTPIAFLVLIGVVEGVSPSMEEAAQTLRASRWQTFRTVSLPLMRPGLANAFLLGFIESLADFGNPLVLGGNFHVLSTEIFFAVVGAQHDPGRAAVLAIVLLALTLGAFLLQQRWLGRRSYTTVTGKGDSGLHVELPAPLRWTSYAVALPWAVLTCAIYAMILFGGFVESWGLNHSFTLRHYVEAFRIDTGPDGLLWSGTAWNSFWTTLKIAAISAPLTAMIGLLTGYILVRQQFAGRNAFEFGTMLSFAIPGTVIGVSYILAFNTPPIEITGTGIILVISFVFRNMPVGVRSGIAALSQIDKSLEEASVMLRASTVATLRWVVVPLLRPAIVAALIFSFVRAMTAISAVIFLVSAEYHMATAYIVGRAENGDYGLAIAYSSVLIVVMLLAVGLVNLAVGRRRIGRRPLAEPRPAPGLAQESWA